jgi:CHAT domain-containing protein/tetratricopeptide (TPR) repeat protein
MTHPSPLPFTNRRPKPLGVYSVLTASLACGAAFAAGPPSQQAKPENTRLQPGTILERELAGGGTHLYSMELAAGRYAELLVEQRGIDVFVQILNAQGKSVAEFDSESRRQGQEHVGLVSDSSCTCEIRVNARYPRDPLGQYEVRVVEIREANEKDKELYEAHRLETKAATLSDSGSFDEGIVRAQGALELAEKAVGSDDAYTGALAIRLGRLLREKGEYAKAKAMLERAVNISQRKRGLEDPQTASALHALGLVYRSTNESAKAEELFQQALEIAEKSLGSGHPRVASYLMQMAVKHENRSDFARAVPELQRALAIAEKTLEPDDLLSIQLLHNLGDVYLNQDDLDHAEPLTQRALEMMERKYGPEYYNLSIPLQNLGSIARQRRQYAHALELLWRAQRIREKSLGPQHPQSAALLLNIGNVYMDEGEYDKGRELFERALGTLQTSAGPYHTLTFMALAGLSEAYSAEGQPSRALEYQARVNQVVEKQIELNLAIGSERAKFAFAKWLAVRTARALSLHLQQAPNDKPATEMAAQVLLQRKARVLDAMVDSRAVLRQHLGSDDQKLLDDLSASTAKLAKAALDGPGRTPPSQYSEQLASLEEQRENLEAEVSKRSAGYYERSSSVSLAAVRAAVPADAALVEFAVYQPFDPKSPESDSLPCPRYVAYVIPQRGDIRWSDLGCAEEIEGAVGALRDGLRDPNRADTKQLARAVDAKVLQPIRGLMGGATHLLISPDGALNLVPFEALLDEQGRYALESYSIGYLTTGRDLLRMQVPRESKNAPLLVADPFFGEPAGTRIAEAGRTKATLRRSTAARRSITTGTDLSSVYFAPLSGTAQEARTIKSLFPEAQVLTGQQATKAALKRVEAPRVLHIATHGFFLLDAGSGATPQPPKPEANGTRAINAAARIENPLLRSGLALAGANLNRGGSDDGILTALEASNLNLWGTKLVTLSACDTGVGEVKNGEGVYGLRRAFFLAGTESLVMSLWPISDYVTRELMTGYYSGLKKGLGRGEALRQAQLTMLKRKGRQHPFYWASFIQSGEWANLDGKR